MTHVPRIVVATFALGASACGDGDNSGDPNQSATVTWHNSIAPIVQANCASCHRVGGSAPSDLTDPNTAVSLSSVMLAAIDSGIMPPWPASDDCHPIKDARRVPQSDVEKLRQWVEGGSPLGDPKTAVALPSLPGPAFEPDLEFAMPEPYTPSEETTDDWRCFVLDGEFPEETFVRATEVVPGSPQVHHVLIYAVSATAAQAIYDADSAEAGPGYTCFGGPNPSSASEPEGGPGAGFSSTGFPTQLGAWVPGITTRVLPENTAFKLAAGSKIIMQVHYNTLNTTSDKHTANEPTPDQSSLRLLLADQTPEFLIKTVPIADPSIVIEAGASASTHVRTVPNVSDRDIVVTTVAGHMHTLGTELRARIVRPDATSECLLDIGDWDFNWQMFYQFPEDNYAVVKPGESIELTCTYDNSPANQPFVDGAQIEPRRVTWGESTLDEMCLLYISTISPYEPEPAQPAADRQCAGLIPCLPSCDVVDATCLLECDTISTECISCVVRGSTACGGAACALDFQASRDCLVTCGLSMISLDGTFGECMQKTCPDTYASTIECFDPVLATEDCQAVIADCGGFPE